MLLSILNIEDNTLRYRTRLFSYLSKESKCPVCKVALIKNDNNINDAQQRCPKCYRRYFPIEQKENPKAKLVYDDIESVSESGQAEPLLLCKDEDTRFYPNGCNKQDDYEKNLRRYFGQHVQIETYEEIPNDE